MDLSSTKDKLWSKLSGANDRDINIDELDNDSDSNVSRE